MTDQRLTLEPPSAGEATALATLVNDVYEESEKGLWLEGATRTTAEEIDTLVRAGQITVARLRGDLVGSVRVRRLDAATSEFGMLAASPEYRGIGVGRALVDHAERQGRAAGSGVMRLELLVPREWSHPSKEFLAAWYGRRGYRPVRTGGIEDSHPHLAGWLATPCDVVVYELPL